MSKPTTKAKKGSDTSLYVGIALLAGVGIYAMNKQPATEDYTNVIEEPVNSGTTTTTPKPVPLNYDKVLAIGSKGGEVVKLQQLLGVTADGVFGPITENKLLITKGVKSVTLNQYSKLSTKVIVQLIPVGSTVQVKNPDGAKVYIAYKKADGSLYSSGIVSRTFGYGQQVGIIKSTMTASGYYVVYYQDGLILTQTRVGFVKASEIEKI